MIKGKIGSRYHGDLFTLVRQHFHSSQRAVEIIIINHDHVLPGDIGILYHIFGSHHIVLFPAWNLKRFVTCDPIFQGT